MGCLLLQQKLTNTVANDYEYFQCDRHFAKHHILIVI